MKKMKKILSLTLAILFIFQVAFVSAKATEGARVIVQDVTAYANSYFYVYVYAEEFSDVADDTADI